MNTYIITAETVTKDIKVVVRADSRRSAVRLAEPAVQQEVTHRIIRRSIQKIA